MALFAPRANTISRVVLVGLLAAPILFAGSLLAFARSPLVTGKNESLPQPIDFDHRHHVEDAGIDCLYCHGNALKGPLAGVPTTEACMGCHGQIWNRSPVLAPLRTAWATGEVIAWNRVYELPDFVYFDHSIHLAKGVGCETCHGRVDRMASIEQASPLTMKWCLDCHRNPAPALRPRGEITTMGWKPPEDRADLGVLLASLYDVAPRTSCTTCHR